MFKHLLRSTRHCNPKPVMAILCPVCGASKKKQIHQNLPIRVVRCLSCTTIYLNPRFVNSQQHYWDSGVEYLKKKYAKTLEDVRFHPRYENYKKVVDSLYALQPTGRFLDVGAHIGNVLELARQKGYEVYGVEPSESMSQLAREYRQLNVFTGFLHEAQYPPAFFDVLTLIDVLEHVEEPKILLKEIHRILKPGGVLLVRIPNGSYETLKLALLYPFFGFHCFDFFATHEHLVHYTQKTLKYQLESVGFSEIQTEVSPPNLDSSGPLGKIASQSLYQLSLKWYQLFGSVGHFASGVSGYFRRNPS
jgi:2-polyprenyl-3-methyl-5-hydroxy-6-metoxy-1,4-benzoquinol methylase